MKAVANASIFVYNDDMNINNVLNAFTNANYKEVLLALLAGLVLGFVFAKLRLPAPAPLVLAGVVGIIGIWLGFLLGGR